MSWLLTAGVAALVALLWRLLALRVYAGWFRQGVIGDAAIHFGITKQLKRDPRSGLVEQYAIGREPMCYPRGFHRFAALFPLKLLRERSWIPGLVLFVLMSAAFLGYLSYLSEHVLGRSDPLIPLLAGAFFFVSVSNLVFRTHSITYLALSERLIGRFSCSAFWLLVFVAVRYDHLPSLLAAAPFATLAMVSSIFARQALLFVGPWACLFLLDVRPGAALTLGLLLALALSGRFLLRGMKYSLDHWGVYRRHFKKNRYVASQLSRWVEPRVLLGRETSLRHRVGHLLEREPTRLLFHSPELVLLLVALALRGQGRVLLGLIAASALVYVVTSTNTWNFLGESYRYLEYNLSLLVPFGLALILSAEPAQLWLPIVGGYVLATLLLSAAHIRLRTPAPCPERDHRLELLERLPLGSDDLVFTVPMRLGAELCVRSECRTLWWQPGVLTQDIHERYFEQYPYLRKDWQGLVAEEGVTHVICDRETLARMPEDLGWEYDFTGLEPIDVGDHYSAYRVRP